jgi:hypothetical protein
MMNILPCEIQEMIWREVYTANVVNSPELKLGSMGLKRCGMCDEKIGNSAIENSAVYASNSRHCRCLHHSSCLAEFFDTADHCHTCGLNLPDEMMCIYDSFVDFGSEPSCELLIPEYY